MEHFRRATELHSLNDATDTDLRPFASHGGKLIMYHGWSDTSIAPLNPWHTSQRFSVIWERPVSIA